MSVASAVPVLNQLQMLSNAGLDQYWEGLRVPILTPGVAAAFPAVTDWIPLLYQAADGTQAVVTLVAPKSAILLADQETVSAPAIAGLTAVVVGNVQTASGAAVTTFIGGTRRKRGVDYG